MNEHISDDGAVRASDNSDDPSTMTGLQDIYNLYGQLRSCPVQHSPAHGGFYWLTRYEDVRAAALDFRSFSSSIDGVRLPSQLATGRLQAIEMDPPEHGFWRRLYLEALTPARLKIVAPRLTAIVNMLIDRFAAAGECDLMKDFAAPLPVLGVCETIGLDDIPVERIHALADQFNEPDPAIQGAAIQQMGGLVLEEVRARRAVPRDDYLTRIALAEVDGQPISDAELAAFMVGFFVAGHETTTSALGTLLLHTLSRDDLKARMLADDRFMAAAIEEAVRLHSPFQAFHRTTTEDVVLGDVTVPAKTSMRLCYGSANRDPSLFEKPDLFDPDRPSNPHLGFGFGRHACVGAPLARLEMQTAFRELLRRLPDIRLIDTEIDWDVKGGTFIVPKTCRVTFTPASSSVSIS